MSYKKIIIRNCPAFDKQYNECHSKIEPHKLYCMDCTDCVLKQIAKLCKYGISYYSNLRMLSTMAEQILQLLDIQEVE